LFGIVFQDLNRVLATGYVNFQYVAIAQEFVFKSIMSNNDNEVYVREKGRFWSLTHDAAIR
jgi:hypothetical protein